MKKSTLLIWLFLLSIKFSYSQPGKGQVSKLEVPVPVKHYQAEYTFDRPVDPASWSGLEHGLHVAYGSTNQSYLRCEVPDLDKESKSWLGTGWKGERLNAILVLWSPDTIRQIRIKVNDLKNPMGNLIPNKCIRIYLIRYVLSNLPYEAKKFNCGVGNDSVYLVPDRFETTDRFDIPGMTTRSVWITADIPSTAESGDYHGTVEIAHFSGTISLELNIKVQKHVLPEPHDWKFRLDLWQNPWVIASYYHVKPWSEEHKLLIKNHLKLYADAGGKFITTYAVYSPWSDNSYMVEGNMIELVRTTEGSWKFDYSIFDQYVKLAIEAGIEKTITVFTLLPWDHRYRYLDEKSGNYVYEKWTPASDQYKTFWKIFLDNLKVHLTERGWFHKTYLGFNENPLEYTMAAIRVIRQHSKDWKITYSGNWHPELSGLLDDYSCAINSEPGSGDLLGRADKGFTSTFYVSCSPARPNNFVFSRPSEGVFIGWYAAAKRYDGFLRWAYDAWPGDPLRDARHISWPAGDCFLVYPGAASCVRFEKLREGITDYEKILILRMLALKYSDNEIKNLLNELDLLLVKFSDEKGYCTGKYETSALEADLQNGKILIQNLSDRMVK